MVRLEQRAGMRALFKAIESGDCRNVEAIMKEHKIDPDTQTSFSGTTALLMAVRCSQPEIVEYLIENGASVDLADDSGVSPLHAAAEIGCDQIVHLLLNNKADVSAVDKIGQTALHLAVVGNYTASARLLLENRPPANIDAVSPLSGPCLHLAIRDECHGMVALLLHNKANVNLYNARGQTPLCMAAQSGYFDLLIALLQHGASTECVKKKISIPDEHDGKTPLDIATDSGYLRCGAMVYFYTAVIGRSLAVSCSPKLFHSTHDKYHAERKSFRKYLPAIENEDIKQHYEVIVTKYKNLCLYDPELMERVNALDALLKLNTGEDCTEAEIGSIKAFMHRSEIKRFFDALGLADSPDSLPRAASAVCS